MTKIEATEQLFFHTRVCMQRHRHHEFADEILLMLSSQFSIAAIQCQLFIRQHYTTHSESVDLLKSIFLFRHFSMDFSVPFFTRLQLSSVDNNNFHIDTKLIRRRLCTEQTQPLILVHFIFLTHACQFQQRYSTIILSSKRSCMLLTRPVSYGVDGIRKRNKNVLHSSHTHKRAPVNFSYCQRARTIRAMPFPKSLTKTNQSRNRE